MSRKQIFANLSTTPPTEEISRFGQAPQPAIEPRANRVRIRPILGSPDLIDDPSSSPVGAIGQSLGEFSERSRRADEIEKKLAEGQAVIELDPAIVDPSFIPDRMTANDEAHARFVEAIREQGQQVPILVRPHPDAAGRYQVAFGHRRLRAASMIGIAVRAVVRDLSDEQLVVAQGQENSERQDLSYIEKARFAQNLQQRFSRDIIMAALSIYKSDLSNMLTVMSRIPEDLIDLIGPAHSVGRRNWMDLAEHLAKEARVERARQVAASQDVIALPSDERFKAVLASLKPNARKSKVDVWSSNAGSRLARVVQNSEKVLLTIDRRIAPDFAEFVLRELPKLYEEYEAKK